MIDFDRFRALTFDCYGTLIDWETGILGAVRPVLEARGARLSDAEVLAVYSEAEPRAQAGEYLPYREVLGRVMEAIARAAGFEPTAHERTAIVRSFGEWRPFPDTVGALRGLASRYELGIISNVDDDLFALTRAHLPDVPFAWVTTAAQARAYKPSLRPFELALERIALPRDHILHVAESLFHDVAPACQLGLATVHVDRRHVAGAGATRHAAAAPDLVVPDLASLAELALAR